MAPKTILFILSSSILDLSSFASPTVFATAPSCRSGANARNPWDASLSAKLLKKSLSPHQACRTRTAPRGFLGDARYPFPCSPSALNSTMRLFTVIESELPREISWRAVIKSLVLEKDGDNRLRYVSRDRLT